MFLTSYVQGSTRGPVNNGMLVLTVQGFTHDGRYALKAHLEIHHPDLPDSLWVEDLEGEAVIAIDDEIEETQAWLDKQSDDAFPPTFAQ
ncbi:MAG: hypothetical protein ACI8UO_005118 [Verrucomicrobiales bacterium]|jgi:hypothetical protein